MYISKWLRTAFILITVSVLYINASAQHSFPDTIYATRCTTPVRIDGMLTEPAWQEATPITNFSQREPQEGAAPTESTEVYILYDDHFLIIFLEFC